MGRKKRIHYCLDPVDERSAPTEEEIKAILRAADELIYSGGRSMLAKILKGSKDKKLLEMKLDRCPSYGYYGNITINDITKRIDWMILNDYLKIDYNGRLPMIVFANKGWETYQPVYAAELFHQTRDVTDEASQEMIQQLKCTNREVVKLLLKKIGESKNSGFIKFLTKWEQEEVKKVRLLILRTIEELKSV